MPLARRLLDSRVPWHISAGAISSDAKLIWPLSVTDVAPVKTGAGRSRALNFLPTSRNTCCDPSFCTGARIASCPPIPSLLLRLPDALRFRRSEQLWMQVMAPFFNGFLHFVGNAVRVGPGILTNACDLP